MDFWTAALDVIYIRVYLVRCVALRSTSDCPEGLFTWGLLICNCFGYGPRRRAEGSVTPITRFTDQPFQRPCGISRHLPPHRATFKARSAFHFLQKLPASVVPSTHRKPTLSHSPSPSLGDSLPTTPLFAVGSPFLKPLLYPPRHGRKKNHRRSNVRKFRIVHSLHYHEHGSNFKVIPKPTSPRSYFFDVRGRYPFSRHPACLVALHLVSPIPAISLV